MLSQASRETAPDSTRVELSAALDGEADRQQLKRICSVWNEDSELRHDWQTWSLVGDVLRSEDLASSPAHDGKFILAFRSRLAQEPVVLAPIQVPVVAASVSRRRWTAPVAAAAGLAVVVGLGVTLRVTQSETPSPAGGLMASNAPAVNLNASAMPTSQQMLRNPELDRYLLVHKQFGQVAATTPTSLVQVVASSDGR